MEKSSSAIRLLKKKKMTNDIVQICPLASGSRGNSLFVAFNDTCILVDAGLSGVEIERRMASVGIHPGCLNAIIITHEHSDHIKGAGVLSRRFQLPVYMTPKTHAACPSLGKIDTLHFFEGGQPFQMGQVLVSPFSISHDACDPVGMTLEYHHHKIGIATDLGVATALVKTHLKDSSLLYLESNHDTRMLMNGAYPWHLKQRIKSRTGHLSNTETADLLSELKTHRLKHVILAHLSEENNCPQKAMTEAGLRLNGSGIGLHVAGPDKAGKLIQL